MTIICFSHIRWNLLYQHSQHLFSSFADSHPVYFLEEPIPHEGDDHYSIKLTEENIHVITHHLNNNADDHFKRQNGLLDNFLQQHSISDYIFWYYSPMMYSFSSQFRPSLIVYDLLNELSASESAPQELKKAEQQLLNAADIVFTGRHSLHNYSKGFYQNNFAFPGSLEKERLARQEFISGSYHIRNFF